MKIKKSRHWLFVLSVSLLIIALLPAGISSAEQQANPAVKLETKVGFEGDYKESGLVPVQVTITNTGPDLEGDLVVDAGDTSQRSEGVAFFQPVSVASGSTKQVTITVPAQMMRSYTYVSLMQGETMVAQTRVYGRGYGGNTLMVGVMADNPDTANFLGVMPRDIWTKNVKVVQLKQELIPSSGVQLQMVDMLILNNYALDTLNSQQIQAIRDWTDLGGMLVVAGGPQYKKTVGTLQDMSPVEVTGVTQLTSLSAMKAEDRVLELTAPFTVSTGTLRGGNVLAEEGGIPLFVSRSFGQGKVLYVAYDLAQEPIASWAGNGRFWAEVLPRAFGSALVTEKYDTLQDGMWSLRRAAELIPSLKLPDVSGFALFFGLYALIAGPMLFFILRYKRKQNYMWVFVPLLSIITGLGIFSFGAYQRGTGVLLHQAGLVELNNDGKAKVSAVTSMFVPLNGEYRMTIHGAGLVQPYANGRRFEDEANVWAWLDTDRAEMRFRNVEFWSMRNAVSQQYIANTGSFTSNLTLNNGKLQGTVTNETAFALRDVRVMAGSQVQNFDQLAPGGTIQVDLNFSPSAQLMQGRGGMRRLSSRLVPGNTNSNSLYETREGNIIQVLEERDDYRYDPSQSSSLKIIGWADQAVTEVSVEGSSAKPEGITLVTAPLQMKPSPGGDVFFPAGSFEIVKSANTARLEEAPNGYYMEKGDLTFDVYLRPNGEKLAINKLYLFTWSEDNAYFSKDVYNWKTGSFDPYDKVFTGSVLGQDKVGSYVSDEGVLRVRVSHDSQDNRHIGRPLVSVEGKVINP